MEDPEIKQPMLLTNTEVLLIKTLREVDFLLYPLMAVAWSVNEYLKKRRLRPLNRENDKGG